MVSETLTFDPGQFPAAQDAQLHDAILRRSLDAKFLYSSNRQALRWLHVHATHSPVARGADALSCYREAFETTAARLAGPVDVLSLGCGGGAKDVQLLRMLHGSERVRSYLATDASPALVLTALQAASELDRLARRGHVADLLNILDPTPFAGHDSSTPRLFLFFGMLPNLPPECALRQIRSWMRPDDLLLVSANLAPGQPYLDACRSVLPQYDNPETLDWLRGFLDDFDIPRDAYTLDMDLENDPAHPIRLRLGAWVSFVQPVVFQTGHGPVACPQDDRLQLFFSNRFNPPLVDALLTENGFVPDHHWINPGGDEGVWLARPARAIGSGHPLAEVLTPTPAS